MTSFDVRQRLRADIFDIRKSSCPIEREILVDTNALCFSYYDRYGQLGSLGEGPREYQEIEYPRFLKRLLSDKSTLFVHRINILEFARTVERAELRMLYCRLEQTSQVGPDFKAKKTALSNLDEYKNIQKRIVTYLHSMMKTFKLINIDLPFNQFAAEFLIQWTDSVVDPADAMFMAESRRSGLSSVLSDDAYFATVHGIRLYTANERVL